MPMDELIRTLDELTQSLLSKLYELPYEEFEKFVDERQKLVDALIVEVVREQPDAAQKDEISRLLENDPEIIARMNALRLEAQDWLFKRNQAKMQRNAYDTVYTPDSFLMDRRK